MRNEFIKFKIHIDPYKCEYKMVLFGGKASVSDKSKVLDLIETYFKTKQS